MNTICEDSCVKLVEHVPTFVVHLLPKLLVLVTAPQTKFRSTALKAINNFVLLRAQPLMDVIEHYINELYKVIIQFEHLLEVDR